MATRIANSKGQPLKSKIESSMIKKVARKSVKDFEKSQPRAIKNKTIKRDVVKGVNTALSSVSHERTPNLMRQHILALNTASEKTKQLVMMICLPESGITTKWISGYMQTPVAITHLKEVTGTTGVSYQGGQQYYSNMFLFRCPQRHKIISVPNGAAQTYTYYGCGVGAGTTLVGAVPATSWTYNFAQPGLAIPIITPYALTTNWHSGRLYGARDGEDRLRFLWVDSNMTLNISFTPSNTNSWYLRIYKYTQNGTVCVTKDEVTSTAGVPVLYTSVALTPGYYATEFAVSTSTSIPTMTINSMYTTGNPSVVQSHYPLPGYTDNIGSATAIRITAVSGMYENQASLTNAQGKSGVVQVPGSDDWTEFAFSSAGASWPAYNNILLTAEFDAFAGKDGVFEYLKPTQPEDFDLGHDVTVREGVLYDSHYNLDENTSFLAFSVVSTAQAGIDGSWYDNVVVEYITTNKWIKMEGPTGSSKDIDDAMEIIRTVPQASENPLHVMGIINAVRRGLGMLGRGISFANRYVAPVLNMLSGSSPSGSDGAGPV